MAAPRALWRGSTRHSAAAGPRQLARGARTVTAAAANAGKPSKGPRPPADIAGGWGVEVPGDASPAAVKPKPPQQPQQQPQQQQQGAPPGGKQKRRAKRQSTPFVSIQSPEAQMGLAMLSESLVATEAARGGGAGGGQQQPQAAAGAASIGDVKASLAAAAGGEAGGKRRKNQPAVQARPAAGPQDELDELEGASSVPAFQLTFGEQGTELIEFDAQGRPITRGEHDDEDGDDDGWGVDADGDDGFGASGWDQFGAAAAEGVGADSDAADDGGPSQLSEADEVRMLRDITNDDDWGLDALAPEARRRPSLLSQMAREQREAEGSEAGPAPGGDVVTWGGSGGATGIDLEEQEELLSRYFRPHDVKRYMAYQREVDDNYAAMKARAAGVGTTERQLHRQLKIIAGSAAGRRLVSARGAQTRPMMEKVRSAIFDMVQAQAGSVGGLPRGCRWLDLFAGTGSVGLEALSRGAGDAHFVEMDPWVHRRVLGKNIAACGFARQATCHTSKAEDFLRRAAAAPRFAGGPFDFISVCPPYLLVSYPELYDLLEASGLIHDSSIVFVEYPKQLSEHVRPALGPLAKVRDRKYGRTWIAVYAPEGGPGGGGEGGGEGGKGGGGGGSGGGAAAVGAEWGL